MGMRAGRAKMPAANGHRYPSAGGVSALPPPRPRRSRGVARAAHWASDPPDPRLPAR
ncbi:hypothetical protein SAMN02799636_05396 [Methylobacterium sp. 275MFSha3.1]|nr:hypothetical protein SAMN02799636_05396 [Methylobacterium sp. 275MFSha3.1]